MRLCIRPGVPGKDLLYDYLLLPGINVTVLGENGNYLYVKISGKYRFLLPIEAFVTQAAERIENNRMKTAALALITHKHYAVSESGYS